MELAKLEYPLTKTEQSRWAAQIMQPLFDGEVDPIEFASKLKGLSTALSEVEKNKEVREIILKEITKSGKSASWNGATLTIKETGVRYDYTNCNDPVYTDLIQQREALERQIKERESFLKNVPAGTTCLDEQTGECYTLHPAVRMATESYAVSFMK